MMDCFTAACIQMNSGEDWQQNLERAERLITQASKSAKLIVLPEFFPLMSSDVEKKKAIAEEEGSGKIQTFLSQQAKKQGVYLLGGTLPIIANNNDSRFYAASCFYAPSGERLARYDKIHLFQFTGQKNVFDETISMQPGTPEPIVIETPLGRLGLSVCYDLRFPELYRAMQHPDLILAPSAFTFETGQAHWQLLLQARAVENLAYVLGAAQVGMQADGRRTYGQSMIVNPWGDVLAKAQTDSDEIILAPIEKQARDYWRTRLPALSNRRLI